MEENSARTATSRSQLRRTPAGLRPAACPVFNPGPGPVDINGWTIPDDDNDEHVIAHGQALEVPVGGFLVLGRNGDPGQNGGCSPDYVCSGINLANGDDEIELLTTAGLVVDRGAYTGAAPWPDPAGASMQLSGPGADNAVGANWTTASARGMGFSSAGTDSGSPGAP